MPRTVVSARPPGRSRRAAIPRPRHIPCRYTFVRIANAPALCRSEWHTGLPAAQARPTIRVPRNPGVERGDPWGHIARRCLTSLHPGGFVLTRPVRRCLTGTDAGGARQLLEEVAPASGPGVPGEVLYEAKPPVGENREPAAAVSTIEVTRIIYLGIPEVERGSASRSSQHTRFYSPPRVGARDKPVDFSKCKHGVPVDDAMRRRVHDAHALLVKTELTRDGFHTGAERSLSAPFIPRVRATCEPRPERNLSSRSE